MINYKIKDGFHILLTEFDEYPIKSNKLCGMCHEPVDKDTDYCSECREFVGTVTRCPDCEGEGDVWDNNYMPSNPNLIDRPTKPCNNCGGTGVI